MRLSKVRYFSGCYVLSRLFRRYIGLLIAIENTKDMNSLEGNSIYYLFVLKLNIYLVEIKSTSFSSRYTGPINRMYLEFLDKFQHWVVHSKTWKIFVSICPPAVGFRGASPTFARPQSLISTCGDSCEHYCIQLPLKMKIHFTKAFLCESNYSQPQRDLWNCATVYDQTCPYVYWLRWGIFWAFVMNCDFINYKNSEIINRYPANVENMVIS
jgi:hypothetical protein